MTKEASRDPSLLEAGAAMKEPDVGLDDDDHAATGVAGLGGIGREHDDDPAAATRRRVSEFGGVEALRATAGADPDQAAQERPRLGAYVRVLAYLAADSSRRLAAHVRGSPAFRGATAAFEPWTTAAVDTLGAAACVATVAAWAGLRAAPAQPRRWARGARLVGDASRRLVASALGSAAAAFQGAAPFLPPGTMRLVGGLAAAGYLATAAARAGILAVLAQPRHGAREALRVLFIAAAAYAIVAAFTDRSVFVIVSAFVPGVVQLGCVIAAVVVAYAAQQQD